MHYVGRRVMAALAVVALLYTIPVESRAQAVAASLEEMVGVSSSVVKGRTLHQESAWEADGRRIVTRVRIAVDEVIAGEEGSEIEILVPGGRVGNTVQEVSDMPSFTDGEEVLLFVWTGPDGRNMVAGGAQGKLSVVRDRDGLPVVRGMGHLLRDDADPGRRTGLVDDSPGPRPTTVSLESLRERIRAAKK
jgi:hypothetical protein